MLSTARALGVGREKSSWAKGSTSSWVRRWATSLRRSLVFLSLCLLLASFAPVAHATNYTWVGNTSAEWTNSANWTPAGYPNTGSDTATFNTPGTKGQAITIATSVAANAITFSTSGWTITSTQNPGITLSGTTPTTPTITTVTGSSTIAAILNGTSLTTAGNGTLTLSGANTYTGGTTVTAGTLRLNGSGTLGSTSANLLVSGGTLDLNGTNQLVANLGPSAVGGTILNNFGSGNRTLTVNANSTYGGLIKDNTTGTGTVALAVTGALALTGANTYSGGTTLNNGSLTLATNASATAGTGSVTVNSGSSFILSVPNLVVANTISGAGDIANANSSASAVTLTGALTYTGRTLFSKANSTFNFQSASNNNLSSVIGTSGVFVSGSNSVAGGNIIKSGTGPLTLAKVNSYTGTTTISAGTLQLGMANAITAASAMTLSGGTFNTGGFSQTFTTPLTLSSSSAIDLGSSASVLHYAASNAQPWTGNLSVINWSGTQTGSGTDRIYFGASNTGLTAAQIKQVKFLNPAGYAAGAYNARQLTSGEVVPYAPIGTATFVKLMSFTATRYSSVLWLNWQTGLEVDNLGFNVYREVKGKKTRLNGADLIAGSALLTGNNNGFSYAWPDALQVGAKYWLEDVDTFGTSTWHGPITPRPGVGSAGAFRRSPVLGQGN